MKKRYCRAMIIKKSKRKDAMDEFLEDSERIAKLVTRISALMLGVFVIWCMLAIR